MKSHAQSIIIQTYGLVITDEALSQGRTGVNIPPTRRMSDDKLRAKILEGFIIDLLIRIALRIFEDRIAGLIGTEDQKNSFFIYGGGTVSLAFHVVHQFSIC